MWLWILFGVIIATGFVAFTGAPYVPSKRRDVRIAFTELYRLSESDVLVDIGSGDGVVLREASKCGATAIGYEIHPVLVVVARVMSRHDKRVHVRLANFWRVEMPPDTTVVYTFGDARDIAKMYDKVQSEASRLGHALQFITYGFDVPGVMPTKAAGAHYLYTVKPLQAGR